MAIDKKIIKLGDLPLINKVYSDMELVAAISEGRKNFKFNATKIKGNKIESITGKMSNESGGRNSIYINFADGKIVPIYYYNGGEGEEGTPGFPGIKGPQGEDATTPKNISYDRKVDIINSTKIHIIDGDGNVVETELTDEEIESWLKLPWSALRGKDMNEKIYDLNELYLTDESYVKQFVETSFIYAEFDTSKEDENVRIFNSDTNNHIVYKKIWTYEDSELEVYYIYNPVTDSYDEVLVNLWKDVYLRDNDTDYYEATSSQLVDGTTIYYFDESDNTYKEVELLESEIIVDDVLTNKYIGDKRFEWYSSQIDQEFIVKYFASSDNYTYKLKNVDELTYFAYESNDNGEYTKVIFKQDIDGNWIGYKEDGDDLVYYKEATAENTAEENSTINFSNINVFYEYVYNPETDEEEPVLIQSLISYLDRPETRYYKVKEDKTLEEVESLDDINTNNYEKYIIETISGSTYTYEYYYPTVLYEGTANEEKYYSTNVLVLQHGSITFYVKDEDRKYYRQETYLDNNGKLVEEYIEIKPISWIYAEFLTEDEDVNVKLLNAMKGEGDEDNSTIDTKDEDYYEEYTHVPMNIIIPGNKTIYKKVSFGKYTQLDFNEYNAENDYYILPEEKTYSQVTHQQIVDNYLTEIYVKTIDDEGNEVYSLNRATINEATEYYILNYEKLTDSQEYLTNTEIDLVIGVPQLLPINIYPTSATDRNLVIEYDSDYITVYEDGSICAVDNSLAKLSSNPNYEGTDVKVVYEKDGQILLSANIHVNLIIPISNVDIETNYKSDSYYSTSDLDTNLELETNESIEFKASYSPAEVSYDTFTWIIKNSDGEELTRIDKDSLEVDDNNLACSLSSDTSTLNLTVHQQGSYYVQVIADDNFGAQEQILISILEPAKYVVVKDLEKVVEYYTDDEADAYNYEHSAEISAGTLEPITGKESSTSANPATIKNQYYLLDCLMGKTYYVDDLITVEPENTTDKSFNLVSSNNNLAIVVDGIKTIVVSEAYEKEATQDDIDNGIATELGEIILIPEETESYTTQVIQTIAAGTCDITGTLQKYPGVHFVDEEYNDIVTIDNNVRTEDGTIRIRLNIKQAIEAINIVPSNTIINLTEEKLLTAILTPNEGVNKKGFYWKAIPEDSIEFIPADNEDPTKVYIKGLIGGSVLVNAYADDGSGTNTENNPCTVKVTIPTKNINLYKDEDKVNDIIYVGIGESKNIIYDVEYQSGNVNSSNTEEIKWSSENPDVATVDNGVVSGVNIGTTTIIGYAGDNTGVFGSIVVEVIRLNTGISFEFNSVDMEVNDTLVLVPQFNEVNGEQSTNQVVVWNSENPEVAKIKSSGIIYALSAGETNITATTTDGTNLTATCLVKVI